MNVIPLLFALHTAHAEPVVPTTGETPAWEATLERVVPAVVAIRVTGVRDFDTEDASSSVGTGFVVDRENGILLTNRHMVHAGPVIAEAVLLDHEEIDLYPVYRDPVHDFGFYRFDPDDVRFMELPELKLAPEAARVGMEIRVIGNDAGEKISILDGTLARLDRNAPYYGGNTYNDFNTFYYQAASNTSGGSSGSPVVDIKGRVVALNAGGSTRAASSFYLPLDRVVRALDHVRRGEPVPRGTVQATLSYTSFDELNRLGLTPESEKSVRSVFPDATGMLVVAHHVPEGPADGKLLPGDILLRVDGEPVNGFVKLEAALDDAVGRTITVELERGGAPVTVEVDVQDLHTITPGEYLEISRGIVHRVSYHQARNHSVPAEGVYVAVAGHMLSNAGIGEGAIFDAIDGVPVPDLDTFQAELESKAEGQRVRVRYHTVYDPRRQFETVMKMDRQWFAMQRCVRDDATGLWPCTENPPPPEAQPAAPVELVPLTAGTRVGRKLAPSLVMVDFDIPHPTAGVKDMNYVGAGVVIDAEQGLVLVDRDTVPVSLGDIELTFAGIARVPGHLVYLHPVHNFAVLGYDPKAVEGAGVRAVTLRDAKIEKGDELWQIGLDRNYQVVSSEVSVDKVDELRLGTSSTPRFRDANVETIDVSKAEPSLGGVLADRKGRVVALWASFLDQGDGGRSFDGLPTRYLQRVLEPLRNGAPVDYRPLGAELGSITLAEARERGLSSERSREVVEVDPLRRKVLQVLRLTGGTAAAEHLRTGDLLVAIDGALVTRVGQLEELTTRERVEVTVVRDGEEQTFAIATHPVSGTGIDRVVSWAGLLVHEPHHDVAAQQGFDPEGVYVAWLWYGSPGASYGLRPTRRIVEINGIPTPDLDAFVDAVRGMKDGEAVRIQMITLDGRPLVKTLELDLHYWPTQVLERANGHWSRHTLGPTERTAQEGSTGTSGG